MEFNIVVWFRENYEKLMKDYENDNLKQENLPPEIRQEFEFVKRVLKRGLERERNNQAKAEKRKNTRKKYYQANRDRLREYNKKYSQNPLYATPNGSKQEKLKKSKSKIDKISKELDSI